MLRAQPPLVLLLDVDNINARICKKVITQVGFCPIHLESVVGFKYLAHHNVAAVVLDVQTCHNSFQTLADVEELFPDSALVIMAGRDDNVQARFAVRLGAKHFIRKPCEFLELHRILRFIAQYGAAPCPATQTRCLRDATPAIFRGLTLAQIERRAVLAAIDAADGDKIKAAKILGIGKTTLYRKLRQYRGEESIKDIGVAAD
jgi:DNA-binding NtrC family response regulator